MAGEVTADFEITYVTGSSVRASLCIPVAGPHVMVLFGPSGSGKSTILRCLAGLERPQHGAIRYAGETWFDADAGVMRPPQARGIGYLFQDYALFPHLTVSGNIGYALSALSRPERSMRIAELMTLCQLEGLEERKPSELSGGEQQRVALARVLAPRPRLLLLDEPLSALDGPTRDRVRAELRVVLQGQGTPAVCVTHDWVEALTLADEMAVIAGGRILQLGSPDEVFTRPANAEVAAIVGVETVIAARGAERVDGLIALEIGSVRVWALDPSDRAAAFFVSIRAEDVTLETGGLPSSSARNHLIGRVEELHPGGPVTRVVVDCGFRLTALVTRQAVQDLHLRPGACVTALIKASAIHLIPR